MWLLIGELSQAHKDKHRTRRRIVGNDERKGISLTLPEAAINGIIETFVVKMVDRLLVDAGKDSQWAPGSTLKSFTNGIRCRYMPGSRQVGSW